MADVASAAIEAGKALIPPRGPGSKKDYTWKLTISLVVIGEVIALGLHIAWACGYLAFIGLPGFASSDAVTQLASDQHEMLVQQTVNDVRADKTQLCRASSAHNQLALTSWESLLEQAEERYARLMKGAQPAVPSCDELLITLPTQ